MDLQKTAQDQGQMSLVYVPLTVLSEKFLEGNSRRHDLAQTWESIQEYGFQDPPKYDPSLNGETGGLVEGNGRLETLLNAKEDGQQPPSGIVVKDGDWHMPLLIGVNFASENHAIAYSIEHNLSGLWGTDFSPEQSVVLFEPEALQEQLVRLEKGNTLPVTLDQGSVMQNLKKILNQETGESTDPLPTVGDAESENGPPQSYAIIINCDDEAHQEQLLQELTDEGLSCKAL